MSGTAISISYDTVSKDLFWKANKAGCAPLISEKKPLGWLWAAVVFVVLLGFFVFLLEFPAVQNGKYAFLASLVVFAVITAIVSGLNARRLGEILKRDLERRGPVDVEIDATSVRFNSSFGKNEMTWWAIDTIIDLETGTGLRSGLMVVPIPNDALPDGMTPQAFRDQLEAWRVAQ